MTTTPIELLSDAFERIRAGVDRVLRDLDQAALTERLDDRANSIGWLIWHLTRVQDDHIAEVAEAEQVWLVKGWADRFALPFDRTATGYGQTSAEVGRFRGVDAAQLTAYHHDVHAATEAYLQSLGAEDLDRVVDSRWDPPVTLAVRLVSVIADDLQHLGQAAFIRGVIEGRS